MLHTIVCRGSFINTSNSIQPNKEHNFTNTIYTPHPHEVHENLNSSELPPSEKQLILKKNNEMFVSVKKEFSMYCRANNLKFL